eukprot:21955_1
MAQKKNIRKKLKGLKLGPPSDKVMKYRKTPVYTSVDRPIYVDWLAPKYNLNENKIIKLNQNKQNNDNTEQKDDEADNNANILAIDFKLGMTICPGKHQEYAASGCQWKRDLKMDLQRLKETFEVDVIVTLLSEEDLKELKVERLVEQIEQFKMKSYWYKIPDGTTPKDVELWKQTVIQVSNELTVHKRNAVVHCMGGLNRTGMFVLSVLKYLKVLNNKTIDNGVRWIGQSRKGAGGNGLQIMFVKGLEF